MTASGYAGSEQSCSTPKTRESTPSRTLTNKNLQQEFELMNLTSNGSIKAEVVAAGKRSVRFTATVVANQVGRFPASI